MAKQKVGTKNELKRLQIEYEFHGRTAWNLHLKQKRQNFKKRFTIDEQKHIEQQRKFHHVMSYKLCGEIFDINNHLSPEHSVNDANEQRWYKRWGVGSFVCDCSACTNRNVGGTRENLKYGLLEKVA